MHIAPTTRPRAGPAIALSLAALVAAPLATAWPAEVLEPEPLGTSCTTSGTCFFLCFPGDRVRVSGSAVALFSITGTCTNVSARCSALVGGCSATSALTVWSFGVGRCQVSGILPSGTCRGAP